jgi:hypothetical protein
MSDDTQRREAWRNAHQATTVTGKRPNTHRGRDPHERAHDDLAPEPGQAQVGHPHNFAPEAAAQRDAALSAAFETIFDALSDEDLARLNEVWAEGDSDDAIRALLTDSEQDGRVGAAFDRIREIALSFAGAAA